MSHRFIDVYRATGHRGKQCGDFFHKSSAQEAAKGQEEWGGDGHVRKMAAIQMDDGKIFILESATPAEVHESVEARDVSRALKAIDPSQRKLLEKYGYMTDKR